MGKIPDGGRALRQETLGVRSGGSKGVRGSPHNSNFCPGEPRTLSPGFPRRIKWTIWAIERKPKTNRVSSVRHEFTIKLQPHPSKIRP